MSFRIQELLAELDASAAGESSRVAAENAEDDAQMLGTAMGMDLGDAASLSLLKQKTETTRRASVDAEKMKEDLREVSKRGNGATKAEG